MIVVPTVPDHLVFYALFSLTAEKLNQEDHKEADQDYAVLEAPEYVDGAEGPDYQVLEQGEGEGAPEESNPDEPMYNVLEAE